MNRITFIVLLFLVVVGCIITGRSSLAQLPQKKGSKTPAVQVDMRNVMYHFTDQVAVHIHQLHGLVLPTQGARLPVFDDVQSFSFVIHFAEIAIGTDALANVLNQYVFAAPDAPIKDIAVSTAGNSVKVHGKLPGKGNIAFETEGTAVATPEGHIRIHAHKVSVARVPVKGLMDLLGLNIAQLINTDKVRGVRLEGNDLILDPALLLPPPRIAGRVTEVQVRRLEVTIDRLNEPLKPLTSFVLPGGSTAAAWCHFARTLCRRAERDVIALMRASWLGQLPSAVASS